MAIDRVVIVGGGLAGLRTAEALRSIGFDGAITLIGSEDVPPYDRPPLSKEVLTGVCLGKDTFFRSLDHYAELCVGLRLGHGADSVNLHAQTVRVGDEIHPYDRLVVATGSRPRRLKHGHGLAGVHVLRTLFDAVAVRRLLTLGPRVVVVGAGFIGAEVASSARALGLDVTIVEAAKTPLARAVGPQLGGVNARFHHDNGVTLICGATVSAICGNGHVDHVALSNGRILECDLVVVGIGTVPSVEWLNGSGLTIGNGLVCDDRLNAGHPAVFAAGDVVRWPNRLFARTMRGEQWANAVEQARYVARNLLCAGSADTPFSSSNYFWSDQYGVRIQFVGVPEADEVRIVAGSADDYRFLACYRWRDRLVGALAMDCPRQLMRCKQLIERGSDWQRALAEVR